jgi:hypothetical protein
VCWRDGIDRPGLFDKKRVDPDGEFVRDLERPGAYPRARQLVWDKAKRKIIYAYKFDEKGHMHYIDGEVATKEMRENLLGRFEYVALSIYQDLLNQKFDSGTLKNEMENTYRDWFELYMEYDLSSSPESLNVIINGFMDRYDEISKSDAQ